MDSRKTFLLLVFASALPVIGGTVANGAGAGFPDRTT